VINFGSHDTVLLEATNCHLEVVVNINETIVVVNLHLNLCIACTTIVPAPCRLTTEQISCECPLSMNCAGMQIWRFYWQAFPVCYTLGNVLSVLAIILYTTQLHTTVC